MHLATITQEGAAAVHIICSPSCSSRLACDPALFIVSTTQDYVSAACEQWVM
jgi:hypothetical protein